MAHKKSLVVALVFAAAARLPRAWAYQVNCNQASFTAQKISSVFGELRPATAAGVNAQGNASARFHTGTDIADCGGNAVVGAIEDGHLQGDPVCGTDGLPANDCEVLVVNTAGTHRFDYIHLTPTSVADLSDGDTVYMGNPVGNVDPNEGHLHLNDVDLASGFKKNPQGYGTPNQPTDLLFSPPPEPQFVPTTVGGVTGSVIPIVARSETNPQTFPLAADGVTYILNGQVDVLVTANGGIPPSLAQNRIGIYSVGVTVTALQPPFNQAYMGSSDIVFNTLCDGHSNPNCASNNDRSAIPNIYLRSNTNSMTFIATNQKINSDPSTPFVNNPIDLTNTATYPPGNYSICPEILGFPGDTPSAPTVNTQCVSFPTKAVEFLDVAALRAVSNQPRDFGLKLGSERLHGIEGREQAFASYSGVGQGAEPSAGVSAAIGCGGPIWTSEKVGPRVEARKVMSPERIGERPLASALRIRTCGLPVYIECPNRIQTWESVWIAARFAGSSGRSTNAVGSLALASPSRIHQVERRAVGALAFPLHHGAKRRDVSRQAGSRRAVGARADDVAEARCSEDFLCRICVAPEGSRLVVTAGKKCRGAMK